MTFNDFVHKNSLKNKATSNIKTYEVLKKIGLDPKMGIFLRDGTFLTNYGIVNLHPSKESHLVCFNKVCYFDPYACPPLENFPNFTKSKHGKCIFSESHIRRNDSFCGSYVLYIM